MRNVYFNGKFYGSALNGVHRVADLLIREVDQQINSMHPSDRPTVKLILPSHRTWTPDLKAIVLLEDPSATSQIWEQFILPRQTGDGVLVSLCNLSPILHRRKITMLHDMQFLFPDSSYPARQRWGYRLLAPMMARTSLEVLTVSEYSRQMLDLCGVSRRERTRVLYNGVDHLKDVKPNESILRRIGVINRQFAVHIGSAKTYKNSAVIAKAFTSAELSNVTLVIVGVAKDQLEKAGIFMPDTVVFAGKVDDSELRSLYENALCLLMPSRTEGFGLPPLEAMCLGCPAVVSPAGAIPEVCRDAALYADVDDPSSWVRAVSRLRDDDALRASKVTDGIERAAAFRWDDAGAKLFERIMEAARL